MVPYAFSDILLLFTLVGPSVFVSFPPPFPSDGKWEVIETFLKAF